MDMMGSLLVIRVNYKKSSCLSKYIKKLFCQAYCVNFQSNEDSFLVKHIVRFLAWHIKFEKRKTFKKR